MHQPQKTHSHLSSYGRLGILLSAIGIILAVDTIADISYLYKFWPLMITLLGTGFIGIYLRRGRRESSYIGIGSYLTGFSFLALYCSLTSWTGIVTLWPLFIGMLGVSCILGYVFGNRPSSLMLLAGLLFVSTAIVFFAVFGFSKSLWWSVFILAGISFYVFDTVRLSRLK